MNRLTLNVLVFCFVFSPVFADDNDREKNVPYFTNQDLEKYQSPSDSELFLDTRPAENSTDIKDNPAGGKAKESKLKRHVVPYIAYEGTARRIIIPVTFNERVTANMLLDTGAPGMHIFYNLAEELDILDKEEGKLWIGVAGIGGSVPAMYTIIDSVKVGGAQDHFIPTIVSNTVSRNFEGLIGMDFMSNYSIQIDTKKHELVFEELPPRPDSPAGHDETWWRMTFRNFTSIRKAWEEYREHLNKQGESLSNRELRVFADKQCREAEELYNRLWVYASENSVPLEWRE